MNPIPKAFVLALLLGASAQAEPLIETNICRQFESAIATWETLQKEKWAADNDIVRRQLEDRMERIRDDINAMIFASRRVVGWQATVDDVTDVGYDDLYVGVAPTCSSKMDISVSVARTSATLASLAKLHRGDIVTITGTFVNPADPHNKGPYESADLDNQKPGQMSVGPMPRISFGVLATDVRMSAPAP